jgi:hypothetical protein
MALTRKFSKLRWLLGLGLLACSCAPARSIELSHITQVQTDQVSHPSSTPSVNDCGYIQSGRYSCNGKIYTSQQLADLRTASAISAQTGSSTAKR